MKCKLSLRSIDNKIKWLQLIRSEGIGPNRFWQFLRKYGSVEQALSHIPNPYDYGKAKDEFTLHREKGYHLIASFEPIFPCALKYHEDCPPFLSVYGNLETLNKPMIGIVGARNASLSGKHLSFQIAQDLGKAGWKIASGLARGIDFHAHQGSLNTGTIAVLAGGIDCIYPSEHRDLYYKIAKEGAIISEMPLGTNPGANLFPRRNRLISGLSQGIVIIEAAFGSGSLITVDYALDKGLDIFAVPGSPADPRCQGSNKLLKQGAILTESAADVLEVMGDVPFHEPQEKNPSSLHTQKTSHFLHSFSVNSANSLKSKLLTDLNFIPLDFETLLSHYSCASTMLLSVLSELELDNLIQRHPGNKFSLAISSPIT